jgi:hypothetical protein
MSGLSRHCTTKARNERGQTVPRADYIASKCLLSPRQEATVVKWINECTEMVIPPTTAIVQNMADEVIQKPPGKNWVQRFIKRHKDELDFRVLKGN